jgi:uncharacterized membrane protein
VLSGPKIGLAQVIFMVGSAVLHLGYFLTLMRGYRAGDLSLVYPLARGTGPMLSTLGAIAIFAERPSVVAISGAVLIAGGAFLLTGGPKALGASDSGRAVAYGLATGILIGAYTLWDKAAVAGLAPILLYYGSTLGRVLMLGPLMQRRKSEVAMEWREHKPELFAVGLLGPISYILVLTALTFSQVSYVAPTREISILLGALLGTRLLAEGDAARRLMASSAMVLGVVALALG